MLSIVSVAFIIGGYIDCMSYFVGFLISDFI